MVGEVHQVVERVLYCLEKAATVCTTAESVKALINVFVKSGLPIMRALMDLRAPNETPTV